jgi:hypothetical protein
MSKLFMLIGPLLARLLSKALPPEAIAAVVKDVIAKAEAALLAKIQDPTIRAVVKEVLDVLLASLLSSIGLDDLLKTASAALLVAQPTASR